MTLIPGQTGNVQQVLDVYGVQSYYGNTFVASTAQAGVAIPVNTTTAPTFLLWNPAGSNRLVVPIRFRAGYVSGATVSAAIGYNYLASAGSGATNSVITAFTAITGPNIGAGIQCANLGGPTAGPSSPVTRFATTSTIVTTTAYFARSAGFGFGAPITSSTVFSTMSDDFRGAIILQPGTAIYPVATAATVALFLLSCEWAEIPI